jgi:ADP-ribosyl-[dinitrogen reductase] hydrolase
MNKNSTHFSNEVANVRGKDLLMDQMSMNLFDRFRGALLGLACGDAVGTTVEFCARGTFTPVVDMVGGGPFDLKVGQWTDDTSMALCLATSLVEKQGFEPDDQMNRYVAWMTNGYLSSTGNCFDIGNTTAAALHRYQISSDPWSGLTEPHMAGNGSIMRLAPVPMFFYPDDRAAIYYAGESSRTTHAAIECVDACRLLAVMLLKALSGATKEEILFSVHIVDDEQLQFAPKIQALARGDYRNYPETQIAGSGYVVNSLEAALWSFWRTDNFREAVLCAVNLGDDADTTAAVCGQLAGAYYGMAGIPSAWLERLAMRDEIRTLAEQLCVANMPK